MAADCHPNQRFNRLIAGGGVGVALPGIDVGAALTGCCNGILKFAYIVSAPLHKQGFFEVWGNPDLNIADRDTPELAVERLKREKLVDGVRKFRAKQERIAAENVEIQPEEPMDPRS